MAKVKKQKERFDLKLYVIKFEDGSYFTLNLEAEEEKDQFDCTVNLSEATFLNKELREKMELVLNHYNHFLYIERERTFKRVVDVVSYGLYQLEERK